MAVKEITLSFERLVFDHELFAKSCKEVEATILNIEQENSDKLISITLKVNELSDIFWIGSSYEKLVKARDLELLRYNDKIELEIPIQLTKLCNLLDTSPSGVVQTFINDLSLQVHGSSGSDERMMAVDYFLRCEYGTHIFDCDQVEEIFDELDAIRRNWYDYGNDKEHEYTNYYHTAINKWFQEWDKLKQEQEA